MVYFFLVENVIWDAKGTIIFFELFGALYKEYEIHDGIHLCSIKDCLHALQEVASSQ